MSYIGREPIIGNFVKLDAISVVNGQASYTMQNGGANFTAYETVNQFLVSLNGILQAPTTSFTVSSSTITFASNLVTGDVIDFILVLGNTLDIGTPSDNTVSLAKLTATGTKDATTFLRGDNTFGVPPLGGITVADQWRLTANFTGNAQPIASNLEQVDTAGQGTLGSAMTQSSGIFTFPSTGIYLVNFVCTYFPSVINDETIYIEIHATTNNSTYTCVARSYGSMRENESETTIATSLIDVTDTSNVKVRFDVDNQLGANSVRGDSTQNETHFTFIRLGDT